MKCILLHGLGQSAASWDDTIRRMDRTLKICRPELSEWIQGKAPCYSNLYGGLENYCEQFEGPVNLCGLSLGGILALQYGMEHPDRVNSLVLIGTQYAMPKRLLKFQNVLFRLMPRGTFEEMGFQKRDFIGLCESMLELDFSAGLSKLRCPVLIICGERDKANKTAAIQMSEQIPNAALLTVPGAGHEVNQDAPDELGKMIDRFFRLTPD